MASSACCRPIALTHAVRVHGPKPRADARGARSAPLRKLSTKKIRGLTTNASSARPVVAAAAPTSGAHIVWICVGDLRVHDHPGLHAASLLPSTTPIVPCFIFDPEEASNTTPAFQRLVHEAVRELRAALQERGADLVVRVGSPAEHIARIAQETGASSLTCRKELEWSRIPSHRAAIDAARAAGVTAVHEWSAPLRECEDDVESAENVYLTTTARSTKGAKVSPWSDENEYAAARGKIVEPLPPPTKLAGYKTRGSELEDPFAGEIPLVDSTRAWAKLPDKEEDEKYDSAVAAAYEAINDPELVKRRKGRSRTDNAFVMFSEERMLALAAEEAAVAIPPVPFRMPGGETETLANFSGFLDFYTATNNREFRKMYDRVLENKLSAFFRLFGTSLALGSLSPRTVYEVSRRWEADSKRSTDLCANARNIAAVSLF